MNKSNKIFLLLIIILLIALVVVTFLYLNMRNTAKENLNRILETSEENSRLNARISELEERHNISTTTNTSTSNIIMSNTNTSIDNNMVSENDIPEEQDYSIDANKITIEVDKNTITPTSISIIITNNNENEIRYGEEYKIQKNTNGKWEDLEYLPNTIWNAMAYTTKGNSQTTRKLNLEDIYGELNKGIYRVIKPIFMGNGKNIDIYLNEFEVK